MILEVLSVGGSGRRDGLATQVDVGQREGLKHDSTIHCDELVSLPKSRLHDFVGSLSAERRRALDRALGVALGLTWPGQHGSARPHGW